MDHLRSVNESYCQHMAIALKISGLALVASVVCFIHAFVPCWFEKTATNLIQKIQNIRSSVNS